MNRTKVTVACQACQKKKVKCTGIPPCTTCARSGHKCIFSNNAKKRGPRNGNVEVIRNPAHRIEYVLQHYPGLRNQIEQMLECNGNKNASNKRSSRNIHAMSQQDQVIVIDDDKINDGLSSFPYLVPTKSKDDITIKPQRRHDQFYKQEDLIQSPIFCKPTPVYPLNMQKNLSNSSDVNNNYVQMGPITSHGNNNNLSDTISPVTNNPLLPPINMELSSSKDLTLPAPSGNNNLMFKRRQSSMSIYNSSLGTPLLLPAPDLGNPLDYLQKSLISNPSKRQEVSTSSLSNNNNYYNEADLNEEILKKKDEKKSFTNMKISLPSPPSYLSSSSSPRSTSTNYYPPTPSSSSPPSSPDPMTSYTPKRSSIHLLSKPVLWCHSFQQNE